MQLRSSNSIPSVILSTIIGTIRSSWTTLEERAGAATFADVEGVGLVTKGEFAKAPMLVASRVVRDAEVTVQLEDALDTKGSGVLLEYR